MVPEGWSRTVNNGRIIYATPAPFSVKIYSKSGLADFHKQGRFLNVLGDDLMFSRKRKKKESLEKNKKSAVVTENDINVGDGLSEDAVCFPLLDCDSSALLETKTLDEKEKNRHLKKLEIEQAKLADAIAKLTIDPTRKVHHKSVLEAAAKRLHEARSKNSDVEDTPNITEVKRMIEDCETEDDVLKVLWMNPHFQSRFSSLFSSKLLEQLISIEALSSNPLRSFPVDVNSNVYADIINFALDNASDVIMLLLTLTRKHETPISTKDVVELAFSFSTLAESASSQNKALKKIKSISMKSSGLTNSGLDSLASVGAAETSRTFRNDRDLLASISEEIVRQYARKYTPQFTFDNLDVCVNKVPHHLTLNFLEFEQDETSGLNIQNKVFEDMLAFFNLDTVLIQSDQEMFEHFQFVVAITLARLFGKEVPGMDWMLSCSPKHYKHPNSETSGRKSLMHLDKPMYLQETKNSEMLKIMENLQLEYLSLVGEQAANREKFFEDLRKILSVDCDTGEREAAESRIKEHCLNCGEMICHGDYLTFERFESCKRLRQGSISSFERFEYMPIFRIGMFHLRMNKTIQVSYL